MTYDRQFIQTAIAIAERYRAERYQAEPSWSDSTSNASPLPTFSWDQCLWSQRRRQRAEQRGWFLAARVCRRQYNRAREQLIQALNSSVAVDQGLFRSEPPERITARTVLAELTALEIEFAQLEVDYRQQQIIVCTEAITLEEIELGPFEIVLRWEGLVTDRLSYRVVATEPNEAINDSGCTHPHVSSDNLCEGEGQGAIRAALAEGRLFDFFVLVRQVLRTYNPESAYVGLDEWYGVRCFDCGSITNSEDRCDCAACMQALCYECVRCCCDCEEQECYECMDTCWDCTASCCRHCLQTCEDCEQSFCQSCLEEGSCDECREKQAETQEETPEAPANGRPLEPAAYHAHLTLQPLRVEPVAHAS